MRRPSWRALRIEVERQINELLAASSTFATLMGRPGKTSAASGVPPAPISPIFDDGTIPAARNRSRMCLCRVVCTAPVSSRSKQELPKRLASKAMLPRSQHPGREIIGVGSLSQCFSAAFPAIAQNKTSVVPAIYEPSMCITRCIFVDVDPSTSRELAGVWFNWRQINRRYIFNCLNYVAYNRIVNQILQLFDCGID